MIKKMILRLEIVVLFAMILIMALCILLGQTVNAQAIMNTKESICDVKIPKVSNESIYENDKVLLDISNVCDGYIMVSYSGINEKVKVLIETPNDEKYSYLVKDYNEYFSLPLTCGNGTYKISVCESVSSKNTLYSVVFTQELNVDITNQYSPFLYSNYYVEYLSDSDVVKKAEKLTERCKNDLDIVSNIHEYIVDEISYDAYKANHIEPGYVPNLDTVLKSGKGICLDYASLMTAMLRSQGIPTKLHVGYADGVYHAWISCYIKTVGWVDNVAESTGNDWVLLDPTLAANNKKSSVKKFIGNGQNYDTKYVY